VDLEEIIAFNKAHIRSKEAEVLAILAEFTVPARRRMDAERDRGLVPPESWTLFIHPDDRVAAWLTIKRCTTLLFDLYAVAAITYVIDAEPFISLLPSIGERVRLKLGTIDKDEAGVRSLQWESVAWQREKPTMLRRFFKWLISLVAEPTDNAGSGPVDSRAQILTGGADDSLRSSNANISGAPDVPLGKPPRAGDPRGDGTNHRKESAHPVVTKAEEAATMALAADTGLGIDRSALVEDFLLRCNQEPDLPEKLLKKHIWSAVGHSGPRQFQYWQASDDKATAEDQRNFGRILAMPPADFVALLKKMGQI